MNIQELYRTFLGKFSFFGKIIDILIQQQTQIQQLNSKISVMETTIKEYDNILSIHNQELMNFQESLATIEAPTKETSRNMSNTGTEIMQSIFHNYHATGEAVTPKDA